MGLHTTGQACGWTLRGWNIPCVDIAKPSRQQQGTWLYACNYNSASYSLLQSQEHPKLQHMSLGGRLLGLLQGPL